MDSADTKGKIWVIFLYASTRDQMRVEQWHALYARRSRWGERWLLGGDLNDIRQPGEKLEGRPRSEASCRVFNEFVEKMNMEELKVRGRQWTWANNWHDEGFIEARLDRFFGASLWLIENGNAIVYSVEKTASDHNLLMVDTDPAVERKKGRFYFDKRWLHKAGIEELISKAWGTKCIGSTMFQVAQKIKRCRIELLKWHSQQECNSVSKIQKLKEEMDVLQAAGGQRDWERWNVVRTQLNEAYVEEEQYWSQKARVQWLQEGDHNTNFFHASVIQR